MIIGIDGNMWYCSNGMCLGDPRSEFTFERTLRSAIDNFHADFSCNDSAPREFENYLDMTPEEYLLRKPNPNE